MSLLPWRIGGGSNLHGWTIGVARMVCEFPAVDRATVIDRGQHWLNELVSAGISDAEYVEVHAVRLYLYGMADYERMARGE